MIDVTKTFLPLVKKSQGRVVNVGSVAGRLGLPQVAAYSITKYGVEAFSDALRREMSPWGVLVSIIEPGQFKTSISHPLVESVKQLWDGLSPELKKDYGEKHLQEIVDRINKSLRTASPDIYKVVDAIVDALTSQRPQTRYVVGLDAKVVVFISYLPTFIVDPIFTGLRQLLVRD
ncbi:hypothetical protein OS493_009210 [Desmophyllum pertusum]|uniref:Uncharacterized protein n=1 Tax=Desmophyllum pertusum TaxID=174260 RepID=A0A9X0CSI2_9CNID|nr:hypothetical protein OS493_009210 [Desmophyllum pertusum]